jgi:hypothetical protein
MNNSRAGWRAFRPFSVSWRGARGALPMALVVALILGDIALAVAAMSRQTLPIAPRIVRIADPSSPDTVNPSGGPRPAAKPESGATLAVIPGIPPPPGNHRGWGEPIIPPTLGPPPLPRGPLPLETDLLPLAPATSGNARASAPPAAESPGS